MFEGSFQSLISYYLISVAMFRNNQWRERHRPSVKYESLLNNRLSVKGQNPAFKYNIDWPFSIFQRIVLVFRFHIFNT